LVISLLSLHSQFWVAVLSDEADEDDDKKVLLLNEC